MGDCFDPGPPIAERMELETRPDAFTVASYVLTRAAERAWQIINGHLSEPTGKVFWVGGPPGCGKTHFLNYVLALASKAGSFAADRGRHMNFALEVAGRVRALEMEAYLLEALADQLSGGDQRAAALWREMGGAAALKVTLQQARRLGVASITGMVDFGVADSAEVEDYFGMLAEVAAHSRQVKFTILAASRGLAPKGALALEVAPAGSDEALVVAVNRSRTLRQGAERVAAELCGAFELGGFDPVSIFPFHPQTLRTLGLLAPEPVGVQAALAREALKGQGDLPAGTPARLVYPADLVASPGVMRRLEARLGVQGVTAFRLAREALGGFSGNQLELATEVLDTLVVEYATGNRARIALAELQARLPLLSGTESGEAWTAPLLSELARRMAAQSRGLVRFENGAAWFDPSAASAPEIAAFNAALGLLRNFDPAIPEVRDLSQMQAQITRLAERMSDAAETAGRVRAVLVTAFEEEKLQLGAAREGTLADYLALAEAGPLALLQTAADPARREAALRTIAAYQILSQAATIVPRMRAMREYVEATGLAIIHDEDPSRDPRVVALETEAHLLAAELSPRIVARGVGNLDALEARCDRFKSTYATLYHAVHAEWRAEMERLARLAEELRNHVGALARLNSIAALGPPQEVELAALADQTCARVVRCDFGGRLAPEIAPRCPGCNYLLGATSARQELADLRARARSALSVKLAALSQSAIARIIREHDRGHHLEGFLKVTQAAQTDALVRVLDDKLAAYLAQLLDENLGAAGEPMRAMAQPLEAARLRAASSRERSLKARGAVKPSRRNDD